MKDEQSRLTVSLVTKLFSSASPSTTRCSGSWIARDPYRIEGEHPNRVLIYSRKRQEHSLSVPSSRTCRAEER